MAYIVKKGTVRHNGKAYPVGKELPGLKKDEAERLLALEVIEEDKKPAKSKDDQKPDA